MLTISQKTYQKLFEKKIEVYQRLVKEVIKNKRERNEYIDISELIGSDDFDYSDYYYFFETIRKIIDENRLYISNNLTEKYEKFYLKMQPLLKEYYTEETRIDCTGEKYNSESFQDIFYKMVKESNNELQSFINQIYIDVKEIRTKIDLS
jgi:hypothetical protein